MELPESIENLFPQRGITWIIFAIFLVGILIIYYLIWPYPALTDYYYQQVWHVAAPVTPEDGLDLSYEMSVPNHIADIKKTDLRVIVTNNSAKPQNVYYQVTLQPLDPETKIPLTTKASWRDGNGNLHEVEPYIWLGDKVNNVGSYTELPAGGQYSETFQVVVPGGHDRMLWQAWIQVGKAELDHKLAYKEITTMTFDRGMVLLLWAIDYLLMPPAANFVLLVVVLEMITLSESLFVWGMKFVWDEDEDKQSFLFRIHSRLKFTWKNNRGRAKWIRGILVPLLVCIGIAVIICTIYWWPQPSSAADSTIPIVRIVNQIAWFFLAAGFFLLPGVSFYLGVLFRLIQMRLHIEPKRETKTQSTTR